MNKLRVYQTTAAKHKVGSSNRISYNVPNNVEEHVLILKEIKKNLPGSKIFGDLKFVPQDKKKNNDPYSEAFSAYVKYKGCLIIIEDGKYKCYTSNYKSKMNKFVDDILSFTDINLYMPFPIKIPLDKIEAIFNKFKKEVDSNNTFFKQINKAVYDAIVTVRNRKKK